MRLRRRDKIRKEEKALTMIGMRFSPFSLMDAVLFLRTIAARTPSDDKAGQRVSSREQPFLF